MIIIKMDGNSPHANPALPSFGSHIESPAFLILNLELENDNRTADRQSRGGQEWPNDRESSVR